MALGTFTESSEIEPKTEGTNQFGKALPTVLESESSDGVDEKDRWLQNSGKDGEMDYENPDKGKSSPRPGSSLPSVICEAFSENIEITAVVSTSPPSSARCPSLMSSPLPPLNCPHIVSSTSWELMYHVISREDLAL
jgi:hypothetical protein